MGFLLSRRPSDDYFHGTTNTGAAQKTLDFLRTKPDLSNPDLPNERLTEIVRLVFQQHDRGACIELDRQNDMTLHLLLNTNLTDITVREVATTTIRYLNSFPVPHEADSNLVYEIQLPDALVLDPEDEFETVEMPGYQERHLCLTKRPVKMPPSEEDYELYYKERVEDLKLGVARFLTDSDDIIPKVGLFNPKTLLSFLLNVLRNFDSSCQLLKLRSDYCTFSTQMDTFAFSCCVKAVLDQLHLSDQSLFGYQLEVETTEPESSEPGGGTAKPEMFGGPFKHKLTLNERETEYPAFREVIARVSDLLGDKIVQIPKILASFDDFAPLLTKCLRYADDNATVEPAFMVDPLSSSAYLAFKFPLEVLADYLRMLVFHYNNQKDPKERLQFHLELVGQAPTAESHNLFFINFHSKGPPLTFQDALETAESKLGSYLESNPTPPNLCYGREVVGHLERVLQELDPKVAFEKHPKKKGFNCIVSTTLHPLVAERVMLKALQNACIDNNHPWGNELTLTPLQCDPTNHLYKMELDLMPKGGAKNLKDIEKLFVEMNHFLIEDEAIQGLRFDNPDAIIQYLTAIFKKLNLFNKIKFVRKDGQNKLIFEISSTDDAPVIFSLIHRAFQFYSSKHPEGACTLNMTFKESQPLMERFIYDQLIHRGQIAEAGSFLDQTYLVYTLVVDTGNSAFAEGGEIALEKLDPEDADGAPAPADPWAAAKDAAKEAATGACAAAADTLRHWMGGAS